MSHPCKVKVRVEAYETPEICPFMEYQSLRDMARRTGLDVGYLSRVQSGKIPITKKRLFELYPKEITRPTLPTAETETT